jgi:HD superfamily phosphodiesterase
MADMISGIKIPDSEIAREAAELVRQHQSELLFNHSVRVFVFGAMKGIRQNLKFDSELLYVAALFHDLGLVDAYHTDAKRFEVDGADAALARNGHGAMSDMSPLSEVEQKTSALSEYFAV